MVVVCGEDLEESLSTRQLPLPYPGLRYKHAFICVPNDSVHVLYNIMYMQILVVCVVLFVNQFGEFILGLPVCEMLFGPVYEMLFGIMLVLKSGIIMLP